LQCLRRQELCLKSQCRRLLDLYPLTSFLKRAVDQREVKNGGRTFSLPMESLLEGKIPNYVLAKLANNPDCAWSNFNKLVHFQSILGGYTIAPTNLSDARPFWHQKFGRNCIKFMRLPIPKRIQVVREATYFYKRLSNPIKSRVCKILESGKSTEKLFTTIDGILLTLYSSCPEEFMTYNLPDQIIKCLISNILFQGEKYLLKYKSIIKLWRKLSIEGKISELKAPRDISFLNRFKKYFMGPMTKHKAFRIAMFTQTRALSAGGKLVEEKALQQFHDTLILEESKHVNYERVRELISMTLSSVKSIHSQPRISYATNACLEHSRDELGKFKAAQELLQQNVEVRQINLHTGERGEIIDKNRYPAEWLFHYGLEEYLHDKTAFNILRVSVIHEPGLKARIITSSPFFRSTLLEPFSKTTIELLKTIPEAQASVTKGRNLFEFLKRLKPSDFTDGKVNSLIMSSDLETATDFGNHKIGRIIIDLLVSFGLVGKFYGEVVKDLLLSEQAILMPKTCGIGDFLSKRGWMMGDPGTKTLLTLSIVSILRFLNLKSACCGDNVVAIVNQTSGYRAYRAICQEFDLKISDVDTYVGQLAEYAEEYFLLPQHDMELLPSYKRTRSGKNLSYIDYPRLRVVLPHRKSNQDYSSSPIGKYLLLGNEIRNYIQPDSVSYGVYQIMSCLQDCYLGGSKMNGMIYVPKLIGGCGKPPPFNQWEYVKKYIHTHKLEQIFRKLAGIYQNLISWRGELPSDTFVSFQTRVIHKYNRHGQNEPWVGFISKEYLSEVRELGKPLVCQPKTSYHQICSMVSQSGLLHSEKEVLSRLAYFEYVKALLSGEEIKSPDVKTKFLEESKLVPESDFNNVLPALFSKDYEVAVRGLSNEYFYTDEDYNRIIDQTDPLRLILSFESKKRVDFDSQLIYEIYQDLVNNRLQWQQKDATNLLKQAKYGILIKDRVEDDPIIVSQASLLLPGTIALVHTDDLVLLDFLRGKFPRIDFYRIPASYKYEASKFDWSIIPNGLEKKNTKINGVSMTAYLADKGSISHKVLEEFKCIDTPMDPVQRYIKTGKPLQLSKEYFELQRMKFDKIRGSIPRRNLFEAFVFSLRTKSFK